MHRVDGGLPAELNPCFMDAICRHAGVYSRTNVRNANAESGVNSEPSAPASSDVETPSRTPSVLTTDSFAVKPAIREVAMRQSSNPSGRNTAL